MKKKKRGFMIKINLTNKWLYTFIAIAILAIVAIGVWAYGGGLGSPSVLGHTMNETAPPSPCSANQFLKWDGSKWVCASAGLQTKVIQIGDWNMDSTSIIGVAHGLGYDNVFKIRVIGALIRNDAGNTFYYLGMSGDYPELWVRELIGDYIYLQRRTNGYFDNYLYDSTSYNRGWVTISYEE